MGATRMYGAVMGDSFTNPPGEQLKGNVTNVDNKKRFDTVANVGVKSYVRNDIGDDKQRMGLIAQELKAAIGETTPDVTTLVVQFGDIQTIDYSMLVCILWGAIKELQTHASIVINTH